jgi:hypothetical protein
MNEYETRLVEIERQKFIKESTDKDPASKPPSINSASPAPQSNPPANLIYFSTLDVFTAVRYRGNQLAVIHSPPSLPFPAVIELPQETKQAMYVFLNFFLPLLFLF